MGNALSGNASQRRKAGQPKAGQRKAVRPAWGWDFKDGRAYVKSGNGGGQQKWAWDFKNGRADIKPVARSNARRR